MIPQGIALGTVVQDDAQQQTSKTYRLDPVNRRITGTIDGIEAVKQAVFLILGTERFKHVIFSFNYGGELEAMSGADSTFFSTEIERRIREALIQDDRIMDVQDFETSYSGDTALVTFTVISIYGNFTAEKEVSRRV